MQGSQWLWRFSVVLLLWLSISCRLTDSIGLSSTSKQEGDAPNTTICRDALDNNSDSYSTCEIARYLRGCQFDSGFFQYLTFQYCTFDNRIAPTIFMILWLILLLGAFAIIADSFFSPSIIALAKSMKMSQSLAGVTLLAFGNGAPDVFSAITAITTGDPNSPDEGLGLGFLLGSGFLVNTVTAGLVIVIKPFKMSRRPFIKDSLFYIFAVSWAASVLIRRQITQLDAIAFLVLYLIYVTTTWLGGTLLRRQRLRGALFPSLTNSGRRMCSSLTACLASCCPHLTQLTKRFTKQPVWQAEGQNKLTNQATGDQSRCPTPGELVISGGVAETSQQLSSGGQPNRETVRLPQTCNGLVQPPTGGRTKWTLPSINVIEDVDSEPSATEEDICTDISHRSHSVTFENMPGKSRARLMKQNLGRGSQIRPTSGQFLTVNIPSACRQRSSSVDSSIGIGTGSRRLSNASQVTSTRSPRSHSMSKRQASLRMSTIGTELPYMVRWIILNRGLEEKDLGKKQNLSVDPEGGHENGFAHSISPDNRTESPASTRITMRSRSRSQPHTGIHSPVLPSQASQQLPVSDLAKAKEGQEQMTEGTLTKAGEEFAGYPDVEKEKFHSQTSDMEMEETDSLWLSKWAAKGVWHHFVYYMIPIELESWRGQSVFSRILQLVQVPIFMVFRLTIPTVIEELDDKFTEITTTIPVDDESESCGEEKSIKDNFSSKEQPSPKPRSVDEHSKEINFESMHGWCKPLNVVQCVIVPVVWPFLLTSNGQCVGLIPIGQSPVPLFVPFMIAGFIMAMVVYFTSRWDEPPHRYHRPLFATLGFITSIIWIYCLAHELVNALETLGIVWKISEAILGLSIMALASSIGDIMSNGLLARNGYPRIAYSACLGSPLFNLLLGAGLPYTVKIARSSTGAVPVSFNLTQALLFTCLIAILTCNILVALFCKFHFKRPYGIFLISVYAVFVVVAILIEVDIIVPPRRWNLTASIE